LYPSRSATLPGRKQPLRFDDLKNPAVLLGFSHGRIREDRSYSAQEVLENGIFSGPSVPDQGGTTRITQSWQWPQAFRFRIPHAQPRRRAGL